MALSHRTDLLTLCHALQEAGIWLYINDEGGLIAGPSAVVNKHPKLLQGLRTQKGEILQLLEDSLAHEIFGEKQDDPRFEREECPECHRQCYVILAPRRLEVHRLPDNKTVCPGSDRAQHATADVIMTAFVTDRCVKTPGAVLTWMGIRGAIEAWCLQRSFLLPPRPYLITWLDAHYACVGKDEEMPCWQGLALVIEEWFGEDEPQTAIETEAPKPRRKVKLKA